MIRFDLCSFPLAPKLCANCRDLTAVQKRASNGANDMGSIKCQGALGKFVENVCSLNQFFKLRGACGR